MPRHIEQPASRHSKPAARKTSSRPSASAAAFTCWEPGTTIAADRAGDLAAVDHRGGLAQVLDPRVGAGADEDAVERDLGHRRARLQRHVGERALGRLAVGRGLHRRGVGDRVGDLDDHPRGRAPGDHRRDAGGVDLDLGVEARAVVGRQLAPALDGGVEVRGGRRRGRAPTRRSSRRGRSSRPGRRPRSSCCRPSSGPASRAPRSPGRRTRPRSRSCRRCRGGRSSPGSGPWA